MANQINLQGTIAMINARITNVLVRVDLWQLINELTFH